RPFIDHVLLLGLDIKMFYAGPKEAVMHAIYRQNFGFTDIVIGRKHADAPYDDGTDIWDGLAAQRKFDELKGELKIKPVKVGFAAFYEELGRVGLVEEWAPKGYKQVSISGRELREKLRKGELPDPRVMRVKVSRTGLYTYPDIVLVCGKPEVEDAAGDTLLNPQIVIEVLSDSTEKYDRGKKFRHYKQIASLREYVLVAQDEPVVERFVR